LCVAVEEKTFVTGSTTHAIGKTRFNPLTKDVVGAAGHILIPAGSKVIGRGFCDPARGRILGRGRWTFYVGNRQISVQGTLLDETKKEGLRGEENGPGQDDAKIKQAIYRDGLYLYIPIGTQFMLKLTGNCSVMDLGSAFEFVPTTVRRFRALRPCRRA